MIYDKKDENKGKLSTVILLVVVSLVTISVFISFSIRDTTPEDTENLPQSKDIVTVTGLVENPLELTLDNIKEMPETTVHAVLSCVATGPLSPRIEGDWTGVKLNYILRKAHVKENAIKVAFYAKDGFKTDLPTETARRDDILLAYERDGTPLTENLRLVVPGKWGYKWIKWLEKIELVDYDFKGTYESSGYSDNAEMI